MRVKNTKFQLSSGFTIAELMIATSVFSVILLVGTAAFIELGRSYYKGITITQTQQAAKQIIDNVSANIHLSPSVSALNTASSGRFFYCIGDHRYSFILFKQVDNFDHNNSSKFGLLADEPSGGGCGNPFDAPTVPLANPAEMLGNHMRLLAFSISPIGSNSAYSVKVTVASGSDDMLSDPNSPTAQCQGTTQTAQFCAITTLSTVVYQGTSI